MLFFYDNGKCAKVPLSSYETKQNRRKLLKAYSDKAELAFMRHLPRRPSWQFSPPTTVCCSSAARSYPKRRPATPPVSALWR